MKKIMKDFKSIFSSETDTVPGDIPVYSPAYGEAIVLAEVNDPVFSEGIMGTGCAILPEQGELYSPVSGEVTALFPTYHAIGINGDHGEEILLHIGVNTVEMNGEGFTPFVKKGDRVDVGTLLIKFDLQLIKEKRYDPDIMVILLNSNDYKGISFEPKRIQCGEALFSVKSS
ncbi:PTS glucose transporter subunit IIA [Neobacillus sp. YIM B06451]|uniref:PTS sugar transporter subunit IIA n=1 Tax=Neobacillus sp. YIM B06451 TaxID=3070994 RepID=UPI0029302CAB|nr:PTS glucose transporter subunit IIA [Neobacillus sp. YIM B06451]